MSKRRVAREVEDLSDEVLGGLTPPQRLQLVLKANASGNERWVDRLFETCPRYEYPLPDLGFMEAVLAAHWFAWQAMFELQTLALRYELRETEEMVIHSVGSNQDGDTPYEEPEQTGSLAEASNLLLANLYVTYHSNRLFATEFLVVELEEWLSVHPAGAVVLEQVNAALDDSSQQERAEAWLAENRAGATADETEPVELTPEAQVHHAVQKRIAMWHNFLDEPLT